MQTEDDEGPQKPQKPKTPRRKRLLVWLAVAAHVLGFVSSVHAVMSVRTSQGAIAWAVVLNTFPYFSVPGYWIFGRSQFQGYVSARRAGDLPLYELDPNVEARIREVVLDPDEIPPAARAAQRMAELPFTIGNRVELLIDGEETFASIFDGIARAEEYILVQFFIIKDDELGNELKDRLIARAREGVRVFVLYDEVGSHRLSTRYKTELLEAGAEIVDFHTRQGPSNRLQINFRNHRKIVVVDGKEAWIGGHNVGDEYMGRNPKIGAWRDTHVRIVGPAALAAQVSFAEDWNWATGSAPGLSWMPVRDPGGADVPVLIIPTGPADEIETATLMFTHSINSAQDRIWIASPYFVPDEGIIHALQLAALRGVDVRILIPDRADHLLVYLAAFSYFDEAAKTGVRFYKYQQGFLHEKTMLIDDVAAAVGTANFDNRSFRLNFEVTALVGDSTFAARVEKMFEDDFAHSRLVGEGEYRDRSFFFRVAVRLARLTSPVL